MDMSTDNLDIMQFFISMLIVGIGVALLATGMFTSYFGAGKSQKIGFALLATGTILLALIYLMAFGDVDAVPNEFDDNSFTDAFVSGVSALSGMIVGLFVILFVLMKVDTVDDLEDFDLEDLEDLDLDEELKKLEAELNKPENPDEEELEEIEELTNEEKKALADKEKKAKAEYEKRLAKEEKKAKELEELGKLKKEWNRVKEAKKLDGNPNDLVPVEEEE